MTKAEPDVTVLMATVGIDIGSGRVFKAEPSEVVALLTSFILADSDDKQPVEITIYSQDGSSKSVWVQAKEWFVSYSKPTEHPLDMVCGARGWKYQDLANAINAVALRQGDRQMATNRHTVYRWRKRGVNPAPRTQRYLAEALGLRPDVARPGLWPSWIPTDRVGVLSIVGFSPSQRVRCLVALREGRAIGAWVHIT